MAAPNQIYTREEIKEALKEASGNIVRASDIVGCDRKTIYNFIERYKSLQNVVDEERRRRKDMRVEIAESNLDERLEAGEWDATRYVLSTLGKDRGYTTRDEIAGVPGAPLEVSTKTADEWKRQQERQAQAAGINLTR